MSFVFVCSTSCDLFSIVEAEKGIFTYSHDSWFIRTDFVAKISIYCWALVSVFSPFFASSTLMLFSSPLSLSTTLSSTFPVGSTLRISPPIRVVVQLNVDRFNQTTRGRLGLVIRQPIPGGRANLVRLPTMWEKKNCGINKIRLVSRFMLEQPI